MNFVSRDQWQARPPADDLATISATSTTAHWEGPTMGTFGHDECDDRVRSIQSYHLDSQGWDDIAYNAVVCPHGYVFEGRGPGHRSAANGTNEANDSSYAVCYLGGQGDLFTVEAQAGFVDAARWLGAPLQYGHRDWFATECPGDVIYAWVHAGADAPTTSPPASGDFPYPSADYLGQESPDVHCHSGYYASDRPNIAAWQARLAELGNDLDADGFYGPISEDVCRRFQADAGLDVDGLVGPATWSASFT